MGERRVWFKHVISASTFESSFLGGRTSFFSSASYDRWSTADRKDEELCLTHLNCSIRTVVRTFGFCITN